MRHMTFPLITLSAMLFLSGCGSSAPMASTPSKGATSVATRSLVEEGTIVFDKQITYKTVDILGVGEAFQKQLASVGIKTVTQLLLAGKTPTARKHLAEDTGIGPKLLMTWINHSDLMRVTGCGPEYARLLERAGVDTVIELARRNSIRLVADLREANDLGGGKTAVKRLPDVVTTTKWVDNADKFVRMISY